MVKLLGSRGALGATFALSRIFSCIALIGIIGMTSNFISTIIQAQLTPPNLLIAVLSIVCIASLYCTITYILFLDNLLPYLVTMIVDGCFLVTLLVVSIVVGKPLSRINCFSIGVLNSEGDGALSFAYAIGEAVSEGQQRIVDFAGFAAAGRATCFESKSVWGLCMALCVFFFMSGVSTLCLQRNSKATSGLRKVKHDRQDHI